MAVKKTVKKTAYPAKKASATKSGTRTVRTVPVKQVSKRSREKETSVILTKDLFQGAKCIEITEGSISVTHATSRSKQGTFEKSERRRYVPKTQETIDAANAAIMNGKVKKVRVEFKS